MKEMLRLETATERTIKVDVTVDLVKESLNSMYSHVLASCSLLEPA